MRAVRMRLLPGILLAVTVGLTLGGARASDASVASKVIAHGGLVKGHLIAVVEVTASAPRALSFRITAKPAQKVKVAWSVVCALQPVATVDPKELEGMFTARAPMQRTLAMPMKHPRACIVNVYGTLTKKGTELIQILQD